MWLNYDYAFGLQKATVVTRYKNVHKTLILAFLNFFLADA